MKEKVPVPLTPEEQAVALRSRADELNKQADALCPKPQA
jgi:hypothetical protein